MIAIENLETERFHELVEHLQQVIWVIDAKRAKALYVSPGYEPMWGRSCQSLLDNPHSYMEGIHPLDQEMMRRQDVAMYRTGHIDAECRVLRPDGSMRWVWIRGYPAREREQLVRIVAVIEDITEKRRLAEESDALLSRLSLQIERMPLAYILFDANFCITDWNPAAERILGYTKEEALGKQPNDLSLPSFHEDAAKIMERLRAGDMAAHSVNENVTKDGRTITCQWLNTPLLTDDGRFSGLLCLGRDVTEQKQIETERERLHEEVRASQRVLEMLSRRLIEAQETERRNIARELHDEIGQILTTINLNLESLRSSVSPAAQHRLDESVEVVHRAVEQVRNLSLDLRPAALDLLGLEITLRGYLTRRTTRAGLTLEFSSNLASRRFSPTLETVCFRLVQEALTNVLRHAHAKRCWVTLAVTEDQMRVSIRDDGIGFNSAAVHDRLMRGEGFGLLSMQERVHLYGGKMAVVSGRGRGTSLRAEFALTAPSSVENGRKRR